MDNRIKSRPVWIVATRRSVEWSVSAHRKHERGTDSRSARKALAALDAERRSANYDHNNDIIQMEVVTEHFWDKQISAKWQGNVSHK